MLLAVCAAPEIAPVALFVALDTTLPAAGATLFAAPLTAEPTPDTVPLTALVACCTVLPGVPPPLEPPPPDDPVDDTPPPAEELVVLEGGELALPAPPPPPAVAPGVPVEAPPDVARPPAAVSTLSRCLTGESGVVEDCCLRTTDAGEG